jgi:stress-induced morphogen
MASRFLLAAARRCSLPLRAAAPAPARPLARGSLAVRAMAGGAQINSDLIDRMTGKIRDALAAERVEVADVQGDGRHVEIVVVASSFEGKSAVNRQRMVYKVRRVW